MRTYFLYVLLGQHAAEGLPLPVPAQLEIRKVAPKEFKFPEAFETVFKPSKRPRPSNDTSTATSTEPNATIDYV